MGFVLLASPVFALNPKPAPNAKSIARRVDAHYNKLRSLSVQFTETYMGMGMSRTESGRLLIARPGCMKWSYAHPAGKLFVVDGKYGYSYTPGDAQAERYPSRQLNDFRSPLRFLLGHTHIEKELTSLTVTPDEGGFVLHGVPKGMGKQVTKVQLRVLADGTIQEIRWTEADGATTEFLLNEERENPPIAPGAFTFRPPPGVVVVRGLAPI